MTDRIIAIEEKEPGCLKPYEKKIFSMGLQQTGNGKYSCHRRSLGHEEKVRKFAEKHGARFFFDDEYGTRSTDYRKTFFSTYPPAIGGMYFCAYCGRLVSRKKVTIDHIYPVAKVSKSVKLRKKLKARGIMSLNDAGNLTPACMKCNKAKGTKMGLWIIRGKIGRSARLWYIRWAVRITALAAAAAYAAHMYIT